MKTRIFTFLAAFVLLMAGCKNGEDKKAADAKPAKQNFSVQIDLSAAAKDDFTMFYTENNTIAFASEMAVWHGVKGGNKRETIVYDLSPEIMPTDIRLDFGLSKDQTLVTIYNIKIAYYGNEMNIKGSDFFKWFIDKDFKTEVDAPNGALKIIKEDKAKNGAFFYPRQELIDALKKLTASAETK